MDNLREKKSESISVLSFLEKSVTSRSSAHVPRSRRTDDLRITKPVSRWLPGTFPRVLRIYNVVIRGAGPLDRAKAPCALNMRAGVGAAMRDSTRVLTNGPSSRCEAWGTSLGSQRGKEVTRTVKETERERETERRECATVHATSFKNSRIL